MSLRQGVWAAAAVLLVLFAATSLLSRHPHEDEAVIAVQAPLAQPPSLLRLDYVDPEFARHPASGVHPLYAAMRRQAAAFVGPPEQRRLVQANLERAAALPPPPGRRFVWVNIPENRLYMIEDGRTVGSMKVVVGAVREPTPQMAGLMQFVVVNPYWNVPVDLVRTSIAPRVLAQGPGYFRARGFEALSGWEEGASVLDPARIDWRAVANGRAELRVRQKPGGENMMGGVKFMLPNELGIYLHDTPQREAFLAENRLMSSGCVRVEDAQRLLSWVFGGRPPQGITEPDMRVDLHEPVAVYITYLTAAPASGGIAFHKDVYGRDPAVLAKLEKAAAERMRAAA